MKKMLLLSALCLFTIVVNAQRKPRNPDGYYKKSEMYKASRKLSTGGALVALGGGLLGGGLILAVNINSDSGKTTTQILAGVGGVSMMLGGVLIGNAGEGYWRSRLQTGRVQFTGNSLTYNF